MAALAACLMVSSFAAAWTASPVHDESAAQGLTYWIYDYVATIDRTGADLDLNGSAIIMYEGAVDISADGGHVTAFKITSSLAADVTGTMRVLRYYLYLTYVTVYVTGTYTFKVDGYYDLGTGTLMRQVATTCLDIKEDSWDEAPVTYYYELNTTDYSDIVVSPPGLDGYSMGFDLPVGSSWSVEWFGYLEATGVSDSSGFEVSCYVHSVVNYEYVMQDTVTSTAGTFDCMVIEYESAGANVTDWYSPGISNSVKVRISDGTGAQETLSLSSYELAGPGDDGREDDGPGGDLMPGVAVSLAAVAVAVAVFMWSDRPRAG